MISTLDATLNQAGRPRKKQKGTAHVMHPISANSNAVVKKQALSSLNLASEINAFEEPDFVSRTRHLQMKVLCKLLPLENRKFCRDGKLDCFIHKHNDTTIEKALSKK